MNCQADSLQQLINRTAATSLLHRMAENDPRPVAILILFPGSFVRGSERCGTEAESSWELRDREMGQQVGHLSQSGNVRGPLQWRGNSLRAGAPRAERRIGS